MHGEKLMKIEGEEVIIGERQLNAHQSCLDASNKQEEQPVHNVHQAELLVVHRNQPRWIWSEIVFSAVIEPEGIAPVKPPVVAVPFI